MKREQDDIRTNKTADWMNKINNPITQPQHSEVQNVQQNNTEHGVDGDEFESSPINLSPNPPAYGPAILMPKGQGLMGPANWEESELHNCSIKLNRGLKAGLHKKTRYPQPVDVVLSFAGSEATHANEDYDVEDGVPRGMLARQTATAIRIQNAVGPVKNTLGTPKDQRPLGVAIVSTLSDDDHSKQTSKDNLTNSETGKAIKSARKKRKSRNGALRPVILDDLSRPLMFTVGEGVSLATMRTGKIGGGKSLTAYIQQSPRDAIDRQAQSWRVIQSILESSGNPLIVPPVISIGGTSFDAYMTWDEDPRAFVPKGAFQYITTTPQDRLPKDVAAAASRKKLESVAGLTCIDMGDVINNIPVVMLDMNDEANQKFVENEALRLVLENYNGLQPTVMLDRSDVIVKLSEYSNSLGKASQWAELYREEKDERGQKKIESTRIQQRDLYLGHSIHLNRHRIEALGTGRAPSSTVENDLTYSVTRAFAQAYGRNAGEIMLSNLDVHRSKIKMAQVVIYLPEDMTIVSRKEQLRRLQDSVTEALQNKFATKWNLPIFVTTYAVPMDERDHPIVSVRLMTHAKDVFDLLVEDTPETFEKILTNVSLFEQKTTDGKQNGRPKNTVLENAIWNSEIKAMTSKKNRGISFFKRWGDILKIVKKAIYINRAQRNKTGWSNGVAEEESQRKKRNF